MVVTLNKQHAKLQHPVFKNNKHRNQVFMFESIPNLKKKASGQEGCCPPYKGRFLVECEEGKLNI